MTKKSTLSESLKSRLKAYSMTAGAVAAGVAGVNAQVVYTDIDPDATTDTLYLDLNNDGTDDFMFLANSFSTSSGAINVYRAFVGALNSNAVAGTQSGSYLYPYALSSNETIDGNKSFQGGSYFQTLAWNTFFSSTSAYGTYGNFISGGPEGYIGLRLDDNGTTYYGWVRLEAEFGEITIKDYAYNSTAGAAIVTPMFNPVVNVVGSDVADNLDGSDIMVTFDKMEDESFVDEYRVFILKSSSVATFDFDIILNSGYTAFAPTGANLSVVLPAAATDAEGNAFEVDGEYVAFVMTMNTNNTTCDVHRVSEGSAPFVLENPTGIANFNSKKVSAFSNGNNIVINTEETLSKVSIYNLNGQLVEQRLNVQSSVIIPMNQASGVYLVKMETESDSQTVKVFVD